MKRFVFVSIIAFGFANGGLASAQTAGATVGSTSNSSMVHSPAVNIDSGIHARGSTTQQSAAADNKGTSMQLPPPSSNSGSADSQSNAPGSSSNALTASPKGPGTGGNDATK